MFEVVSALRTRLTAVLLLAAFAFPLAVSASPDCYKDCNDFSLDVYEKTGDRAFADQAYDKVRREELHHVIRRLLAVVIGSFALAATAGCAPDGADLPEVIALQPFASSGAPFSNSVDIAIVSEGVACVINSFESRIHCVDHGDGVAVFGRDGEGPGEFERLTGIERGRAGLVVAMEFGDRITFFTPDGTVVSETRLPGLFQPRLLRGDRLFGFKLAMLDALGDSDLPDYVPMVVDASSGEVLWERTDLADAVGRECFNGAVGASMPNGGLVFQVCGHELALFAHRDALTASVVASPSYVEALPNERDVSDHIDAVSGIGRRGGSMSASQVEAIVAEFREKPKEWLLKPITFGFDDQNRLWVATTRDRDAFSYFDIWTGTEYAGAVRVQDRLMGFDIYGSTLVTLVERTPDEDGIGEWAIDWYDLSNIEWSH